MLFNLLILTQPPSPSPPLPHIILLLTQFSLFPAHTYVTSVQQCRHTLPPSLSPSPFRTLNMSLKIRHVRLFTLSPLKVRMINFYYCLDIFNFIEKNELEELSQSLSTSDRTCKDDIRCHCFIMNSGLCLRINTLPAFMESNRLVILIIDIFDM